MDLGILESCIWLLPDPGCWGEGMADFPSREEVDEELQIVCYLLWRFLAVYNADCGGFFPGEGGVGV